MIDWYLGTMGFSYSGWQGVFYPADLPARSYLAHYGQVFNAVEVDSTFYGIPRPGTVQRWAAITPAGFRFCPKVPKEITHEHRLSREAGAVEAMEAFLRAISPLDDKLGPALIQLPPSFTAVHRPTLEAFLQGLPPSTTFAVEFRDPSWHTADTAALLEAHGIAWVVLDYLDLPKLVHVTTGLLYVRWIGTHGRFPSQDREFIDPTDRLRWWWQALQPALGQVKAVYGFFNDDYAGHSPATCNRFKAIAGLPVVEPQLPRQDSLF